jgi:hypothetical protein
MLCPFEPRTRRIADLAEALAERLLGAAAEHDRRGEFALDNLRLAHEAGDLRLAPPREHGGEDADVFDLVVAQQILARRSRDGARRRHDVERDWSSARRAFLARARRRPRGARHRRAWRRDQHLRDRGRSRRRQPRRRPGRDGDPDHDQRVPFVLHALDLAAWRRPKLDSLMRHETRAADMDDIPLDANRHSMSDKIFGLVGLWHAELELIE